MAPKYSINPDRKYESIAVVGGGIGGLTTVIGLLHQGVPVEIYEGKPTTPPAHPHGMLTSTPSRSLLRRNRRRRLSRSQCRPRDEIHR